MSDGIALTRQDAGVEVTTNVGDLQITAAGFDPSLQRNQITPDDTNAGTLRFQAPVGPVIVELDALRRLRHDGGIYGLDVRYPAPRIIGRLEYFNGDGPGSGQGGYVDVQYRVPKLPRTPLVAWMEYLKPAGVAPIVRHTMGVRQIFWKYFQLNVNYTWGHNLLAALVGGTDDFSPRGISQIEF